MTLRTLCGVSLLALLTSTASAVTIDTFSTNQNALSAPPDVSSSVTGGADIIGTRRGMVTRNLLGVGPTGSSVAGGSLTLTVTATTPDSRGQSLITWDGDTNATVLSATGLAGQNLSAANASGFRLNFVSSSVTSEIELTVYSNASNFSRAARRLPVMGSATNVFIPFTEFVVAGGTGASFSNVGAIEMTVRSGEGSVILNLIETTSASISASKIDTQLTDADGDNQVDPGERVRYTVTITNSGNQAFNVDLVDSVDAKSTLVAGSVSSTPIAHPDQYLWTSNVNFATDGSATRPHLLANDQDGDGDTVTVQSGTFPATSAQGGPLTLVNAATGAFSYNPPTGFAGVDSFSYTIVDDNGNVSTATAYITLN